MKNMNLQQLIFQNNFTKLIIIIFVTTFISINAQSEIPEKYKINSSLAKCKGTDYNKWDNCYGEYVFPRNEYRGEWKNGAFHGQGVLREAWGGIYVGGFKNNSADGFIEAAGIDENENSIYEATKVDENQDGKIDYILLDKDEDGENELVATDFDQDGNFDKVEPLS